MGWTRGVAVAAVVCATFATSAVAQDRTGYRQIAVGDLAGAEATLVAERRIFPDRPELMLNLASIYARTGRTADAAALYRATLAADDVLLELPNGTDASSHALAQAGAAALGATQVATR